MEHENRLPDTSSKITPYLPPNMGLSYKQYLVTTCQVCEINRQIRQQIIRQWLHVHAGKSAMWKNVNKSTTVPGEQHNLHPRDCCDHNNKLSRVSFWSENSEKYILITWNSALASFHVVLLKVKLIFYIIYYIQVSNI